MVSLPTISVPIPCHNAERFIGETPERVFRQLEAVVADEGMQDDLVGEVPHFPGA